MSYGTWLPWICDRGQKEGFYISFNSQGHVGYVSLCPIDFEVYIGPTYSSRKSEDIVEESWLYNRLL